MAKFFNLRYSLVLPALLAGALMSPPALADDLELVLQAGHRQRVTDAVWTDNDHILSASDDGSLKVWHVPSQRVRRTLWHPDPKLKQTRVCDLLKTEAGYWASYSDGSILLWSLDGKITKTVQLPLFGSKPLRLQADSDGHIYCGTQYKPIYKFSADSEPEVVLDKDSALTWAVSPDGKSLAYTTSKGAFIKTPSSEKKLTSTFANYWGIDDLHFGPDSKTLYVGTTVNWMEAWDINSDQLLFQLPVDKNAPEEKVLRGNTYGGRDLGLIVEDYDAERLLLNTPSGQLYLLDRKSGAIETYGDFELYGISEMSVSPDGTAIAGAFGERGEEAVPVLRAKNDKFETVQLGGRALSTYDLAERDGKLLMANPTSDLLTFDLKSGQPLRSFETGYFSSFVTGKNRLYCGGNDGILRAYDLNSGQKLWETKMHNQRARFGYGVLALAMDPSETKLAVSVGDTYSDVVMLNASDGSKITTVETNKKRSFHLVFSADGSQLLYNLGKEVFLYDTNYRKVLHSWNLKGSSTANLSALIRHPLNGTILAMDGKGRLATIQPKRLDLVPEFKQLFGLPYVDSVRLVGSNLLLSAGRKAFLCEPSGKILNEYGEHLSLVTDAIAVGDAVITTGWDSRVEIWDKRKATKRATVLTLDEGKEWLVLSPDYHFDGSEKAQDLIEWRWNGELFKVSRFFEKYYQPGLLARAVNPSAFKTQPVARSQSLGDKPPTVNLKQPKALGGGLYEIGVELQGALSGTEEVRLYHNGHRVPGSSPFKIKAVDGRNRLRASAFNKEKTVESKPARLTFVSDVPPQPTTLHVFAAAVNDYPNPLDFAVPDAKSFSDAFQPGLYDNVNRVTLLDEKATKESIIEALKGIDCQPQDTLLVFLAGHGTVIEDKFHYLPHGSDGAEAEKALSSRELGDILSRLPATKQVLFLDTCHAGASAKDLADLLVDKKAPLVSSARGSRIVRDQKLLARQAGTFLVAGSTPDATAAEVPELGHGIFTYAVLNGLKEKNNEKDDHVTVNELLQYLNETVPELSLKFRGSPHGIWQFSAGQDFPIARP